MHLDPSSGASGQRLTTQEGDQQQGRKCQPQESPGPCSPSGPGSLGDSRWDPPRVTVGGRQGGNVSRKEG